MCSVCGCSGQSASVGPNRSDDNLHRHDHDHGHHHHGRSESGLSVPGLSDAQLIEIEQDILSKNSAYADAIRKRLAARNILALNLVSSPGAGKTTLLEKTVTALKDTVPVSVVEGDQETSNDADRIACLGVPAVQVNTGRGCHLDAHMVGHALDDLSLEKGSVVFIENVGNLVCPASFDLGEACKVVILSVAEGDDKPLKYPDMFDAAEILVLNKIDLLPHVDFDVDQAIERAHRINPELRVVQVSARNGSGMDEWLGLVLQMRAAQFDVNGTSADSINIWQGVA